MIAKYHPFQELFPRLDSELLFSTSIKSNVFIYNTIIIVIT